MIRLWKRIPMALRAALWTVLMLLALLLLWGSLDFAVPSPTLAVGLAQRQALFGPGQIVVSDDIQLDDGFRSQFNRGGRWYVVRDGGHTATVVLRRVWDYLWTTEDRDHPMQIHLLSEDVPLSYAWVGFGYQLDAEGQPNSTTSQQLVCICAYDDRFARVEATMSPNPPAPQDMTPEERAAWRADHASTVTAVPAGDRVWTALITLEDSSSFSSLTHLKGYDAQGNLIYESDS